ncbi:MAG: hypothetical protein A3E01_09860 [Gammaproteobacteria bacterium RIFCSPHIGHO2_12_FULL_63_22]|nr:MAG: hypothetical protein A3E01_09860 [Gammaproteobacteria bacterium RIFCSPHIGHO2_12_FULL_63_22]
MKDLMNNIHLQPAFAPKAAVTDGTAQVSASCNRQNYESVVLALITGTLTDADAVWSVLLEESDDDSTYTAVADADLIGTEALAGFAFGDDGECRKIGYRGTKKYLRATIDDTTANTGNLFLAGVWILGNPRHAPTANPPA